MLWNVLHVVSGYNYVSA